MVYTLKLDSLRFGLNWGDSRKSFCFNDMAILISGFFMIFHDMGIFGPLQSFEKRGQLLILARVIVGNNGVARGRIGWPSVFFAGGSIRDMNL